MRLSLNLFLASALEATNMRESPGGNFSMVDLAAARDWGRRMPYHEMPMLSSAVTCDMLRLPCYSLKQSMLDGFASDDTIA